MAKNEFKLSYTAEDINNKLGKVEEHSKEIVDLAKDIDNLSIFITPQMYGAAGDGVNDDTEAIQAAFDACEGGIVYFPAGRYKTTQKLKCYNPITIKMFRPYPSSYQQDYPKSNEDNWMGARIETSSPDIGITIGDGVCLDGFYIRAMPGFGGWDVIDYKTSMENDENLIALEGTAGRGIVLQYDGTQGKKTYPSTVRFSNIQVDMAPLLKNDTSSIEGKNVYIIPKYLFEFKPYGTYNYVFENITLGLEHNRYCDEAFRVFMDYGEDYWCNNVYIKNMCINCRCDYGVNIINNSEYNADGWVFENLNIQAYDYIHRNYTGPIPNVKWERYNNPLNREQHKSLIKLNKMKDLTFFGCYLHDVVQYNVEQGYSEGLFQIEGQEIHIQNTAITNTNTTLKYDPSKNPNLTQKISCIGCSQEFEHIETYFTEKLEQIENNIDNSINNLGLSLETTNEGQKLTLQGAEGENPSKTVIIPTVPISDEVIGAAVSAWMDEATTPITVYTDNKLDENNNVVYSRSLSPYSNCNINTNIYPNPNNNNDLYMDSHQVGKLWTTHYIPAKPGDYISVYNYDKETGLYTTQHRKIWSITFFKSSNTETNMPQTYKDVLGNKDIYTISTDYYQIPNEYPETSYIKLVFMPFNFNNISEQAKWPRYQALWPGDKDDMLWPSDDQKIDENLMIMITKNIPTTIPTYQPYQITTIKLGGLLPTVTTADNGKVLMVVDGKWTAVSHPTLATI